MLLMADNYLMDGISSVMKIFLIFYYYPLGKYVDRATETGEMATIHVYLQAKCSDLKDL